MILLIDWLIYQIWKTPISLTEPLVIKSMQGHQSTQQKNKDVRSPLDPETPHIKSVMAGEWQILKTSFS